MEISAEKIKSYLNTPINKILIKESISSTNTVLKNMADEGCEDKTLLIALSQTNGRGRIGNGFYSPKSGLYMSILIKDACALKNICYITPAAACAMRRAVFDVTGKSPLIKWVNDLYLKEKKICGILAESSLNPKTQQPDYCVLGVGINLVVPDGGFPDNLKKAGTVYESSETLPPDLRSRVCAEFLNNFFRLICENKELFADEYRKYSFLNGKRLCFTFCGEETFGTAEDTDSEFRLIVRKDNGEIIKLSSGEVKIKEWTK